MRKKIIAITLILALLINITIIKKEYYAAAPLLLAPAAKYLIGGTIAAAGLYAATDEDLQYVIWDYYNKAADNIKQLWYNAALIGGTVGKALIENTLISDITNYLNANYTTGENIIEKTPEKVKDCFNLPDNTIWAKSFITFSNGAEFIIYITYYEESNKKYITKCFVGQDGYRYYGSVGPYPIRDNSPIYVSRIEDGIIYYYNDSFYSGKPRYYEKGIPIPEVLLNNEIIDSTIGLDTNNFVGSSLGFGTAINNSVTQNKRPLEIPVPPVPPDTWDDTWLNDLEKELNSLDNPFLDDQTLIEEWNSTDYDWYVDKDGNLYKKPKGEPPKEDDDIKLIPGLPIPDPNNPPEDPDLEPDPLEPVEPCPYCPPNPYPSPNGEPCPNPYCPNQPNPIVPPTPNTPTPPGENKIDFEPLKLGLGELTNKFPFSLPWDLKRAFENLYGGHWDAKIPLKFSYNVLNVGWEVDEEIDLVPYENIIIMFKTFIVLIFDVGLIFATRRLMGGDV